MTEITMFPQTYAFYITFICETLPFNVWISDQWQRKYFNQSR